MTGYYLYVAHLSGWFEREDGSTFRELLKPIEKVHVSTFRKMGPPPLGVKRKAWRCGDKESEAIYCEQGWFPGPDE